ncbi:putative sugar O-methyltransferase [Arsukibacterium sp.]|uniref:putative sugar O-methyltransferase n=1 Tax=Arsukibacterium sp. TaxID=1977258 RepID=UPI00299F0582|nr:putative sugar O-methyltransferase [Arsukibacterium sp.]MDX1677269.1 putative sugar O-methyltransferase [Arsukibacterium sp.]
MSNSDKFAALDQAFTDMETQNALYKPSSFWADASVRIAAALKENGVENFRRIAENLMFFVPTYGCPGNSFTPQMQNDLIAFLQKTYPQAVKPQQTIAQLLSGYQSALADYRVFVAAEEPGKSPKLINFSESDFGNPVEQFEFDNKKYSRSSLNYLLGLQLLKQHLTDDIHTILEIGGGFGTLGEILAKSDISNLRYIDVDIPPTLFVADSYLKAAVPDRTCTGYLATKNAEILNIEDLPEISVLASWQLPALQGEVDLFVNFISFQEMEPHIVKNYFSHVDRLQSKWILLRNMKEGKQIKKSATDIGVEQPILSDDYISMLPNYQLVSRQVHPFGFKTVDNYHSELLLFKRK